MPLGGDDPNVVHQLIVPGEATRREYAVYLLVGRRRDKRDTITLYVGKTGDNREGCNPVVSRVGNHMSFNRIHAQTRNRIPDPENYDFQ